MYKGIHDLPNDKPFWTARAIMADSMLPGALWLEKIYPANPISCYDYYMLTVFSPKTNFTKYFNFFFSLVDRKEGDYHLLCPLVTDSK